jgi:hypothetical protein
MTAVPGSPHPVCAENLVCIDEVTESRRLAGFRASAFRLGHFAANAAPRRQLIALRRKLGGQVRLTNNDRWIFIRMYCWFPSIMQILTIIRPATLWRWHRAGFRHYWR